LAPKLPPCTAPYLGYEPKNEGTCPNREEVDIKNTKEAMDKIKSRVRDRKVNSGRRDKAEGVMGRAKGQIKKTAGTLTGNKNKKAEGHMDRMKGGVKWARGRLKDLLK
jgi:uncharacterized protein YjbJ (UPF0337 family)